MNQGPLIPLINNAALLIAMVVVYEALSTRIREQNRIWWQVLSGLILGGIGMAVMFNPWVLSPGVVFDTRSVILGLSGLFFGTIPTLLAVLLTGALRLWMGGSGALMGIAVIASSGGIGLLWRHLRRRELRTLTFWELYLFGLLIHIVMLLCSLLLPPEVRLRFFSEAALPVMLIYPLATALAGWAMAIREQRRHLESEKEKAEETLRLNEARLRSLVEILQSETRDLKNFLAFALEKAIELTGSKVGFISLYDKDEKRLRVSQFSKVALEECGTPNPPSAFDLETGGLWAEAIRQRKPLIINDYKAPNPLKKGYPEGHIELHRLLAVPVFRNGEIVGLVALGNKENDYEEMDAIQTGLLMETVWRTVERKRAEEALVQEKERAQKYLEVAGVMFVVLNTKGEVTLINQKGCEILGYPQEEIIGKNWFDHFLPSKVGNQVKAAFKKMISAEMETLEYYENPVLTRDGEERVVAWHNTLLKDEDGN
ncbi:MAG: LytS/YhcK type 5TM receptor domain-containing protein, partial [bacterium]